MAVGIFITAILSFHSKFNKRTVRLLSNFVYLFGFMLVLHVVYLNNFNYQAYFLLTVCYGFYTFSLSSIKLFFKLNVVLWGLTFLVLIALRFETITPLYLIAISYLFLCISGFATANTRNYYKKKINERGQLLNLVFNNSSNSLLLIDKNDSSILEVNKKTLDLFGYEDINAIKKKKIEELKINNIFIINELSLGETKVTGLSDGRLLRFLVKEINLFNHSYLFLEIEEFKDRQELSINQEFDKLKSIAEESYESMFKNSSSLICIINKSGEIIDINDTFLEFVDLSKEEVIGRKFDFLDNKNYTNEREIINKKAWEGESQLFEKEIVSKDGSIIFIEVILRKSRYFGEEVLISNSRDISQRKMLEKIADYQQSQYSILFKESPIGLIISDLEGNIIEINKSFENLLGYTKNEILGKNVNYFSGEEKIENSNEAEKSLINGEKPFLEMQKKYISKNGKEIHTLLKIILQKDEDNRPSKLLAQIIDISAFIKAEASIKASEKSYRDVFNSSFELLYILDENNLFIDVSNSVLKEYGYSKNEILGKKPDFLAEQTKMDLNAAINKVNAAWKGKDQDIFWWSKRKDGSCFPKKLHIKKGLYFDKEVLICSGKNIQNDFEYEQQLLKSEKKYKELINRTIFGTLIFKDEKVVFANQTTLNILKYKQIDDLIGVHREDIFTLDANDRLLRKQEDIFAGKEIPLKEFEMIDANGNSVFVESKPSLIEFEGEQCIFSSFVEISDRKRIQAAEEKILLQKSANKSLQIQLEQNRQIQRRLQNSQSYSEGVIESSLDMIFTTDINGKINKLNSSAKKQLQLNKEDFIKQPFDILLNDQEIGAKILEQLNRTNSFSGEAQLKRKDGSVFPAFLSISHLFNIDGTFMGIMGISRDISELVSKETEIKKQASKLNAIIESSSHYFFTVNRNFRITSFNHLFKKDVKEKLGVDIELYDSFFDLLVDKTMEKNELSEFWKEKFSSSFEGKSQKFEIKRMSIDQVSFYREIYLNPVLSENGEIEEISGIGHDITQKKLNELELTNSLNEKEILLKEVHHRVKNNMQVISSILNLQSSYVSDQHVLNALRESQNRIRAMASIHERLYRTKNLSDIKFSSYIKDLAESLVNTYELSNTSVELFFSLDEVFLSLNTAIPCGLILNELISNSLKYAFEGRKEGIIEIRLIREKEKISLSLRDNGVGIPEEVSVENTDTLGLQLVSTLVEQIEGELKVERLNGTMFTFTFNVNMGA